MQRVAIARALANRPALLLADEPTGELDEATGDHIADLFDRVNADGTALVVVTHDPRAGGARATRRLAMSSGRCSRMIARLALRSLVDAAGAQRRAVVGFGSAIAVMAALLGVGEVILEQARSPALAGGGDVVLSGGIGPLDGARYVLTSVLGSPAFASRVAAASPSRRGRWTCCRRTRTGR